MVWIGFVDFKTNVDFDTNADFDTNVDFGSKWRFRHRMMISTNFECKFTIELLISTQIILIESFRHRSWSYILMISTHFFSIWTHKIDSAPLARANHTHVGFYSLHKHYIHIVLLVRTCTEKCVDLHSHLFLLIIFLVIAETNFGRLKKTKLLHYNSDRKLIASS